MDLVCVFCEEVFSEDTVVCPNCTDYKGLMPIAEASEIYDFIEVIEENI